MQITLSVSTSLDITGVKAVTLLLTNRSDLLAFLYLHKYQFGHGKAFVDAEIGLWSIPMLSQRREINSIK
jgi:hypothetical protein